MCVCVCVCVYVCGVGTLQGSPCHMSILKRGDVRALDGVGMGVHDVDLILMISIFIDPPIRGSILY